MQLELLEIDARRKRLAIDAAGPLEIRLCGGGPDRKSNVGQVRMKMRKTK
jgi:hypothetical protein